MLDFSLDSIKDAFFNSFLFPIFFIISSKDMKDFPSFKLGHSSVMFLTCNLNPLTIVLLGTLRVIPLLSPY